MVKVTAEAKPGEMCVPPSHFLGQGPVVKSVFILRWCQTLLETMAFPEFIPRKILFLTTDFLRI